MPTRNTQVKTTRTRTPNKPHVIVKKEDIEENKVGGLDFLRFGESYTSLILGIIVVVIATVLLLSFVRGRNMAHKTAVPAQKVAIKNEVKNVPNIEHKNKSIATNKGNINPEPVKTQPTVTGNTYTVKAGDSLWTIAEQTYKSGYNWVDIAQANNLSNPSVLYSGMKLTLPKVAPKLATATTIPQTTPTVTDQVNMPVQTAMNSGKITGTTYTIEKGDNLWQIAVRAYGDGYQWTKIAKANNLTNPGVINVGNSLSIPR
jgi:nucleoid-associated protein YgaU